MKQWILKETLTLHDLQDFAEHILSRYHTGKEDILIKDSFCGNNHLAVNFKTNRYLIKINFRNILKKKVSNVKKLFCVECDVLHELEHAMTFIRCKTGKNCDYDSIFELLEYFSQMKGKYRSMQDRLNLFDYVSLKMYINRNYEFSVAELKSNLYAYQKTLEDFKTYLDEEIVLIEEYTEHIKLLLDVSDVCYIYRNLIHKTPFVLRKAKETLEKNPFLYEEFQGLCLLFQDGKFRKMEALFAHRHENPLFYSHMILSYLLHTEENGNALFKNPEFKEYAEEIINAYNHKVMKYYAQKEKLASVVKDAIVLSENLRILKVQMQQLSIFAKENHIKWNSGIILDYKRQ